MFNFKIKKNESSGFTIIEAMIAAAVISVGLIGILTLCTVSMKFGRISLNRVIAANLAQEGIEVIRLMRDNLWLNDPDGDANPWNNPPFDTDTEGIVVWNPSSGEWTWNEKSESYYSNSDSQVGFYLDAQGRYIQGSSSPQTNFYRIIKISSGADSDGYFFRQVVSKVKWKEGNKFYEIQTEDRLYNWK
jgi:Tfp pilus assembly protein PilV